MSFRDVGKRWRSLIERHSPETVVVEQEPQSTFKEQPSPKSLVEQIDGALTDHNRGRNVLKEQGLTEQSNTVRRYNTPRKRRTAFSKLNDEIVQFQKMVNELKKGTANDVMTPEDQWRFQILLKSVQEMDVSLAQQIEDGPWHTGDGVVKASFSKLNRDYERVHNSYKRITNGYFEKQRAEVAFLSRDHEEKFGELNTPNRRRSQHNREQVRALETEDFFDRTMREREDEMKDINRKVHIVNDIFSDLGRLVSEQQEQIDKVEDNLIETTTYAEEGVEQLRRKKEGNIIWNPRNCAREAPPPIREENISWSTPFQTFQKDIHEVGGDLVDLVHVGAKKLVGLKDSKIFECGPGEALRNARIFQCSMRDNGVILSPETKSVGYTDMTSYGSLEDDIMQTAEIRPYPTRPSRRKPR